MIPPLRSHDALLADIEAALLKPEHAHLWWFGQSGFLIQWQGKHLLFDPYLSDSLTHKYAGTDKPHVRMTELVVDPGQLSFVDVVTSSHNHTDHLDAETVGPMLSVNPQLDIVVGAANRDFAADRLKVPPERLRALEVGQSWSGHGFTLHAVPAAHEQLERDERGRHRFLGFVVELDGGAIYHSGDTVRYEGQVEQLRQWPIDVAILPINGRLASRRVSGNLWGREAAQLAHDIGAGVVVPCHYDMFTFNTVTVDDFEAACRELAQPFQTIRVGERFSWLPGQRTSRS